MKRRRAGRVPFDGRRRGSGTGIGTEDMAAGYLVR
jgi:hypothetical protein